MSKIFNQRTIIGNIGRVLLFVIILSICTIAVFLQNQIRPIHITILSSLIVIAFLWLIPIKHNGKTTTILPLKYQTSDEQQKETLEYLATGIFFVFGLIAMTEIILFNVTIPTIRNSPALSDVLVATFFLIICLGFLAAAMFISVKIVIPDLTKQIKSGGYPKKRTPKSYPTTNNNRHLAHTDIHPHFYRIKICFFLKLQITIYFGAFLFQKFDLNFTKL